ncbi:hypothetical protein ACFX13_018938 [Malus domestica]
MEEERAAGVLVLALKEERSRSCGTTLDGDPATKCKLWLLKLERIKDYLLMEEEFVTNQGWFEPHVEKVEEDISKVDDLRGSSMSVGNLEDLIDENHAIVSSYVGLEYYVGILSFLDKDQLEPGCAILGIRVFAKCGDENGGGERRKGR